MFSVSISMFDSTIAGFNEISLQSVERMNIDTLKWEECPSMTIPRTKFAAVQIESNDLIYILGGKDAEGNRTCSIEIFNYGKGSFDYQSQIKMKKPRSGFSAVSYKNERIYVIGGNDGRV